MTQVYAPFSSRKLRMARALPERREKATRRDLTSEEKRIARHMAHKGATTAEIGRAIGWALSTDALRKKLNAVNIHPGSIMLQIRNTEGRR